MPYSPDHKRQTRKRIVACARHMFILKGYSEVSIDEIMAEAGLTRGGFYNHFKNKEQLFAEAIASYLECQIDSGTSNGFIDHSLPGKELAHRFVDAYLSDHHLSDMTGLCPLIALPSDVARGGPDVKAGYQKLFEGMVSIFERNLKPSPHQSARDQALALAATCIGGMVLARAIGDGDLSDQIRRAAQNAARQCLQPLNDTAQGDQIHLNGKGSGSNSGGGNENGKRQSVVPAE